MKSREFRCQACGRNSHDIAFVVDGYPILKCKTCGIGRVDIENFDPKEHYDEGYFTGNYKHSYRDYLGSKKAIAQEFSRILKVIRSSGPSSGRLLEIGCAYGLFLQQAKEHYDVYGIEIVAEAAEYCRQSGLTNVKHGVLERIDTSWIESIDVAVMLDVIEHIDNIEEIFSFISETLRAKGTFVLTTGDWASIVARLTGKNWRLMAPPLHLWYFTPLSLRMLGERFGLRVAGIEHPWKIVPIDLVIQQAGVTLGLNPKVNLPVALRSVGIPANMWDAMRVTFVKQ